MTISRPRRIPPAAAASPSTIERVLQALGADPAFAESVLGDLAEEFASRAARDGVGWARWWYLREALRSAPHLAWSGVRRASWRLRARWAGYLVGGAAVVLAVVVGALWAGPGPPARLVAGNGDAEGVTINNRWPVPLPMRVYDGRDRLLQRDDVRYEWLSGAPILVSPNGVLSCTQRGDATVRATLGMLSTRFPVRCRPVKHIRAVVWNDFVVGDPERELPVEFVGPDGLSVSRIAGRITVRDSSVATVAGLRIRPLSPGRTHVEVLVGDEGTSAVVTVFEPVRSLEDVRADQRWVAAPVRLARGETLRWTLPVGLFDLVVLPGADRSTPPVLAAHGAIMCLPRLAPGVSRSRCLRRSDGTASLTVSHPGSAASVTASIALARDARR